MKTTFLLLLVLLLFADCKKDEPTGPTPIYHDFRGSISENGTPVIRSTDGYLYMSLNINDGFAILRCTQTGYTEPTWRKSHFRLDQLMNVYSIAQTTDGSLFLCGRAGNYPNNDVLLVKANTAGDTIWNQNLRRPGNGIWNGHSGYGRR